MGDLTAAPVGSVVVSVLPAPKEHPDPTVESTVEHQ